MGFYDEIGVGDKIEPVIGNKSEPPIPSERLASRISDANLAFSFLAAVEMFDLAATIHAAWKATPEGLSTYTAGFTSPDGSIGSPVIKSFDEMDRFFGKIRQRRDAFESEVIKRGFHRIPDRYIVGSAKGCAKGSPTRGKVKMEMSKVLFKLQQGSETYIGATVRRTVVLMYPGATQPPLFGRKHGKTILLRDLAGKCTVRLLRK